MTHETEPDTRGDGNHRAERENETELIDYIVVILKRKWLIICGTLICALVVGVFSLLQARTYEAEALLVVSPALTSAADAQQGNRSTVAPLGTEIAIPSMAVQTYQVLARSDELLYALADSLERTFSPEELKETGAAEHTTVDLAYSLSGQMEVELVKETAKAKSPILILRYASSVRELPVRVVNLWTELFLSRHRGLSSNVTEEFYERMQAQYKIAKASLEQAERRLRELDAGYHVLREVRAEISLKDTTLRQALVEYENLRLEAEAKEGEFSSLTEVLASLEEEGSWIGYLPLERVASLAANAADHAMRRKLLTLVRDVDRLKQDSIAVSRAHTARLRAFGTDRGRRLLAIELKHGIQQLRRLYYKTDSTLTANRQELEATGPETADIRLRLAVLEENMAQEPRVFVVTKAVSDDALWDRVTEDGTVSTAAIDRLSETGLHTEVLNQVHLQLAAEVRELMIKRDTAERRKLYLEQKISVLSDRLGSLRSRLDSLELAEIQHQHELTNEELKLIEVAKRELAQELDIEELKLKDSLRREASSVLTSLGHKRKSFEEYRVYYVTKKARHGQLERELLSLRPDVDFARDRSERLRSDLRAATAQVDSLELEHQRLERSIPLHKDTYERFAKLREEARIAREQAAGDIQVVSRATIAKAVPRTTVKRIAIAALLGIMASVLVAFILEYMAKVGPTRTSMTERGPS